MARPSKPIAVINAEGRAHRTLAEKAVRAAGEAALMTGTKIKERPEVKAHKVAHREFVRISNMLDTIQKNDAIYEVVINRYCMLQAECADMEKQREAMYAATEYLHRMIQQMDAAGEMTPGDLLDMMKQVNKIYTTINGCDRTLQSKRQMMFNIERESAMTIAAALRIVPKQEAKDEDPLLKLLQRKGG